MSKWREKYKVHPAADVFPMMADDELAELQANIRAHGVKLPVVFWHDGRLLDGRNRLEAMERLGIDTDRASIHADTVMCGDPAAWVITLNIHRRHLTKQQRADLIVKALEASRQNGESDAEVKAKAVETGKQHGIAKRTVERSLAEVEGRAKKKRKPKSSPVPDHIAAIPDDEVRQMAMPCGTPIEGWTITGAQLKEQFRTGQLKEDRPTLKQYEKAIEQAREWALTLLHYSRSRDIPRGVTAEKIELYRQAIMETRKALDLIAAAWSDHVEGKASAHKPSDVR